MRFSVCTLVMVALMIGLAGGTSFAQLSPGEAPRIATATPVAVDREQATATIADRWMSTASDRGYDVDDWRSELIANLQRVSPERLAEAARATSYGEMVAFVTGKNPEAALSFAVVEGIPQVLGDKSDDLSFTAINPCRVLDTRFGAAEYLGPRTPGSTTTISSNVTSRIALQGGNAAGCPLPAVDAGAIAYNVTVVDYTGNAFVTVFPYSATRPNASTINMGPGTAPSPLANSSIVQQCVNCGANTDVSIYVEGASTNVIIDVVGYFDPTPSTTCSISATNLVLTSTCQPYVSCALTNPSTRSRAVICSAQTSTRTNSHVGGVRDLILARVATTSTDCSATVGTSVFDIPDVLATTFLNASVHAQQDFTLAAGATQTYYLNLQLYMGTAGVTDTIWGNLRCTLLN